MARRTGNYKPVELTPHQQKVEDAVRAFERMRPALSDFASAMAGKRLSVRLGDNTMTDGSVIYVRPPVALGEEARHERHLCDRRDDNEKLRCPACARRESVMSYIYHELSHLTFGSFDTPDIHKIRAKARQLLGTDLADDMLVKPSRIITTRDKANILEIFAPVNPYLPHVLRAVEDARVEGGMNRARPGTYLMRRAKLLDIAANGMSLGMSEEETHWDQLDLNIQLTMALLWTTAGLDADDAPLEPYVVQSIKDKRLVELGDAISSASSIDESAAYACAYLVRAQELGFFLTEDESENFGDPNEDTDDTEEQEEGDGEQGGAEDVQPDSEGEDPQSDEGDEPEAGDSGSDPQESASDDPSDGDSGDDGDSSDGSEPDDDGNEESSGGSGEEDAAGDGSSDGEPDDSAGSGDESDAGDPQSDGDESSGEGHQGGGGEDEATADADQEPEPVERPADGFGTPESLEEALDQALGHDEAGNHQGEMALDYSDEREMDRAQAFIQNFDERSGAIYEVKVFDKVEQFPRPYVYAKPTEAGEKVLGPSLLQMRRVMTDNANAARLRNKRSGRVNSRVLGRRAWNDDDRLFTKKQMPGKKDYAVVIGVDASGSTVASQRGYRSMVGRERGNTIFDLELSAAIAQAELCNRLGIKFAFYIHSGDDGQLWIMQIKGFDEAWDAPATARRLKRCGPHQANLDGHTIEYYRKQLDRINATDKILMYYSDGAMPAENYDEELHVLQREIQTCKKKGYVLMAVGVRTDAPAEHGLDTARLDEMSDIPSVVKHLGKRLTEA